MKLGHTLTLAALAIALSAAAAPSHAKQLFFEDTYTFDPTPPATVDTDVNKNLAARQAGAPIKSAYTQQIAGNAINDALLNDSAVQIAGSDVLLLRTRTQISPAGLSETAVDLVTNFAPILAGNQWSVSWTGDMAFGAGSAADRWQSISIGGGPVEGPNGGATDLGLLLRDTGAFTVFEDSGVIGSGGAGTTGIAPGVDYTVLIEVDETGANPFAQVFVTTVSGTVNLGTFAFDFEGVDTQRRFELRGHQGANGTTANALGDYRIDNLQIYAVPAPAALPAGLALMALVAARRRRSV